MTAAAAYRHKTDYAVLAVDGRITDEHGTIYTDRAVKFCQAGHLVWVFAGDMGPIQETMQKLLAAGRSEPHRLSDVRTAMSLRQEPPDGTDWSALVYDSREHALYTCDSDGTVLREYKRAAAIGSGSEVTLGYLMAREGKKPWTLADARLNIRGAIRTASKRNCQVSPRCTVLTVRTSDGKVSVRG